MADIKKKLVDGAGLQAAMGIMANYADKGVRGAIGGYNQSFPLTAATKGNIYYHKGTNRYYICVDNYNGSSLTNPNSKFEELSVYTNRQRLDNSCEVVKSDITKNYNQGNTGASISVVRYRNFTIVNFMLSNGNLSERTSYKVPDVIPKKSIGMFGNFKLSGSNNCFGGFVFIRTDGTISSTHSASVDFAFYTAIIPNDLL